MYEELVGLGLKGKIRAGNIIGNNEAISQNSAYIVKSLGKEVVFARIIGKSYYDMDTRIQNNDLIAVHITEQRLQKLGFSNDRARGTWNFKDLVLKRYGIVWVAKAGEHLCNMCAIHELQNFYLEAEGVELPLPSVTGANP